MVPKTRSQLFVGQYHGKADDPSISEHTNIQPLHHKLWDNLFSEVGQCRFTAAKKNIFPQFLETIFFAMKIANHHDKQLTLSESWDQDGLFEPGFGVSSNSNCAANFYNAVATKSE